MAAISSMNTRSALAVSVDATTLSSMLKLKPISMVASPTVRPMFVLPHNNDAVASGLYPVIDWESLSGTHFSVWAAFKPITVGDVTISADRFWASDSSAPNPLDQFGPNRLALTFPMPLNLATPTGSFKVQMQAAYLAYKTQLAAAASKPVVSTGTAPPVIPPVSAPLLLSEYVVVSLDKFQFTCRCKTTGIDRMKDLSGMVRLMDRDRFLDFVENLKFDLPYLLSQVQQGYRLSRATTMPLTDDRKSLAFFPKLEDVPLLLPSNAVALTLFLKAGMDPWNLHFLSWKHFCRLTWHEWKDEPTRAGRAQLKDCLEALALTRSTLSSPKFVDMAKPFLDCLAHPDNPCEVYHDSYLAKMVWHHLAKVDLDLRRQAVATCVVPPLPMSSPTEVAAIYAVLGKGLVEALNRKADPFEPYPHPLWYNSSASIGRMMDKNTKDTASSASPASLIADPSLDPAKDGKRKAGSAADADNPKKPKVERGSPPRKSPCMNFLVSSLNILGADGIAMKCGNPNCHRAHVNLKSMTKAQCLQEATNSTHKSKAELIVGVRNADKSLFRLVSSNAQRQLATPKKGALTPAAATVVATLGGKTANGA